MSNLGVTALVLGGLFSGVAALAHLACMAIGPAAYRFMGAGERMARAVAAGKLQPTLVTLGISVVLLVWALYAFAGAGVLGPLPLTPFALPAISLVYLARAFCFPLLRPMFPENSTTFWWVSSGICLVIGTLYAVGTVAVWARL